MIYTGSVVDRISLKRYILSTLGGCFDNGEGFQDIELTDQQLEFIIDDTMVEFLNEIYDGYEKTFIKLPIVQNQIRYELPADTLQVMKLYQATLTDNVFKQAFYNSFNDPLVGNNTGYSYLDYTITNFHLNQIDAYMNPPVNFDFNNRTKMLTIFDISGLSSVLVECFKYAGETQAEFDTLYGHQFVKKMCCARAYKQWYQNIVKFDAPIYDGNVKVDKEAIKILGDTMYEEASQELRDKWSACFGSVYKP